MLSFNFKDTKCNKECTTQYSEVAEDVPASAGAPGATPTATPVPYAPFISVVCRLAVLVVLSSAATHSSYRVQTISRSRDAPRRRTLTTMIKLMESTDSNAMGNLFFGKRP